MCLFLKDMWKWKVNFCSCRQYTVFFLKVIMLFYIFCSKKLLNKPLQLVVLLWSLVFIAVVENHSSVMTRCSCMKISSWQAGVVCSPTGQEKAVKKTLHKWHLLFGDIYLIYSLHAKSFQLCPTVCDPIDCSSPDSSGHWILQARILDGLLCPLPGDLTNAGIDPASPTLEGGFFTTSATWEA